VSSVCVFEVSVCVCVCMSAGRLSCVCAFFFNTLHKSGHMSCMCAVF